MSSSSSDGVPGLISDTSLTSYMPKQQSAFPCGVVGKTTTVGIGVIVAIASGGTILVGVFGIIGASATAAPAFMATIGGFFTFTGSAAAIGAGGFALLMLAAILSSIALYSINSSRQKKAPPADKRGMYQEVTGEAEPPALPKYLSGEKGNYRLPEYSYPRAMELFKKLPQDLRDKRLFVFATYENTPLNLNLAGYEGEAFHRTIPPLQIVVFTYDGEHITWPRKTAKKNFMLSKLGTPEKAAAYVEELIDRGCQLLSVADLEELD